MNLQAINLTLSLLESGDNPRALGDRGAAIGCLQIHPAVVKDVNQIYHTSYQWPTDCFDRRKSLDICNKYLSFYGRAKTESQIVRIWNGGPTGHTKPATIQYLHKYNAIKFSVK